MNTRNYTKTWWRSKWALVALCVVGLGGVFYGMVYENDVIFVVGLIIVAVAYLVIRKQLKTSIRQRTEQ
ncbi:MAG: hypothetical protein JRH08_09895 [Deltaproteobacteria bacterium]|nr:hypothetical protein [Deltaproteobacteria bacterium]MBW1929339.1 hypothetical protein [Deltaproteobacteria bacterium]MBW2125989.1 hypothetical protein [Deltaproteobacteria bacterium]